MYESESPHSSLSKMFHARGRVKQCLLIRLGCNVRHFVAITAGGVETFTRSARSVKTAVSLDVMREDTELVRDASDTALGTNGGGVGLLLVMSLTAVFAAELPRAGSGAVSKWVICACDSLVDFGTV